MKFRNRFRIFTWKSSGMTYSFGRGRGSYYINYNNKNEIKTDDSKSIKKYRLKRNLTIT